ncbi:Phosphoribosylanthranilate isomerase [Thermincola ferriacetica]|uniref:N-(5'-phosphoribosyl)anthranilate isomerase n=1 Tax=Thermincola ferriacetica TaxID=281456 RepID=A0A0L6VYE7_9FIRM|nr:phosphoribosylanthranilate isomerase [Thermincola ferriacetica]KNZ68352.1 Phosphoribosylanthranilate isomerase [Thermincola ferriacetica]
MVRVKICGITNPADAVAAASYGADAIGLVFATGRRQVTIEKAREIANAVPPYVNIVGVFVDEAVGEVNRIIDWVGLDTVQLHGSESPEYCREVRAKVVKGIRVREGYLEELASYKGCVSGFLLDTFVPGQPGGTGQTFDWSLAVHAKEYGPVILAGGLTPENVRKAIETTLPYGVDVSSGVETGGMKNQDKMRRFIEQVRRYNYAGTA